MQADCCSIVPSDPRFTVVGVRPFRAAATRCLYELFILPGRARRDGVSLLHYFGNVVGIGGPKSLVTVYDLIPFEHHAGRTFRTLYMRAMIPRSVRKARITLPMSNSTREQILTHVKTHGATLRVIPNPLASRFRRAPAGEVRAFAERRNLPDKYLLYVSHYYPHKNHLGLLEALSLLVREQDPSTFLTLCGRPNEGGALLQAKVKQANLENNVALLSDIPDDEMPLLYSGATALVFPSFSEGGGIPVMEAMACGCPVAASDIPAIREFGGDAIKYFDPNSVESIAAAATEVTNNPELLKRLTERGLKRASAFLSSAVAGELLLAYEEALGPGRAR